MPSSASSAASSRSRCAACGPGDNAALPLVCACPSAAPPLPKSWLRLRFFAVAAALALVEPCHTSASSADGDGAEGWMRANTPWQCHDISRHSHAINCIVSCGVNNAAVQGAGEHRPAASGTPPALPPPPLSPPS